MSICDLLSIIWLILLKTVSGGVGLLVEHLAARKLCCIHVIFGLLVVKELGDDWENAYRMVV